MSELCDGIVEVCTVNRANANKLLDAGYRLLDVGLESFWQKNPTQNNDASITNSGIIRRVTFVLGRTPDVERVDLQAKRESQ